jgi:hypothetical protein
MIFATCLIDAVIAALVASVPPDGAPPLENMKQCIFSTSASFFAFFLSSSEV